MIPQYVPIIRAKKGEFDAYENLPKEVHKKILPLFELPKFTENTNNLVICKGQPNPIECYLNDLANKITKVRGLYPVLVDIFKWAPNSTVENGEHVLNYFVNQLNRKKTPVIPVVGYDRWEDPEYSNALSHINSIQGKYCLRLESYAFEDMIHKEYFLENIDDIVATLNLDTSICNVILDFGDITNISITQIQEKITKALTLLSKYRFEFISIAGCSLTTIINKMVPEIESTAIVVRREMIAWQSCKEYVDTKNLIFGDYGIFSPSVQDDIIAPDANGKIRYTIQNNYFVVRGHSRRVGNKGEQMYDLSKTVIDSVYYMGKGFSWGDQKIMDCSNKELKGNGCTWVAIDTNHHTHTVLAEIFEFERTLEKEKFKELLEW